MTININRKPLDMAIAKSFNKLLNHFEDELNAQLEADKWQWAPGVVTNRVNGETVSSPRNIIDTGELKRSLVIEKKSDRSADFTYTQEYSALVHEGARLNSGQTYPPRPWVEQAYKEGDLVKKLAVDLEEEIN